MAQKETEHGHVYVCWKERGRERKKEQEKKYRILFSFSRLFFFLAFLVFRATQQTINDKALGGVVGWVFRQRESIAWGCIFR